MHDLKTAKKKLSEEDLTLCIVKDTNVVLKSGSRGISAFLGAIEELGEDLEGASVADRVVGRAIALLCVHAKVKAVYAVRLSKKGKAVFQEYMVHHEWSSLVESILDIDKEEICPFEKLATEISDPAKAYRKLKDLQHSFSS